MFGKIKEEFLIIFGKPFYYHPYLICLLFFERIALLYFNSRTGLPVAGMLLLILLSLLIATIFYLIFFELLGNKQKAALINSAFLFGLFFFAVGKHFLDILIISRIQLMQSYSVASATVLMLTIFIIIFTAIKFNKRKFLAFNKYLNFFLIALFIFNLKDIDINRRQVVKLKAPDVPANSLKYAGTNKPDIYYIITDAYTSPVSLKKYWGYDDSELTGYLNEKGFYIADSSRSCYTVTIYSLNASLNMSYLDFDTSNFYNIYQILSLTKLLKDSTVVNELENNGYKFVNYSLFDIANRHKYYRNIFFEKTTPLLYGTFPEALIDRLLENSSPLYKTNLNIATMVKRESEKENKAPRFIYAHLMMPHFPYYFKDDGTIVVDKNYTSRVEDMSKYLSQLKFTNLVLIDMINHILHYSRTKPVIIIQGDHGARIVKGEGREDEAHTILNAYYFPDQDYSLLSKNINPVNSFRVLFKKFFDGNIKLLNN